MLCGLKKGFWVVVISIMYAGVSEPTYSQNVKFQSHEIDCLAGAIEDQHTQINLKRACPKLYAALWQNQLTDTFEFPLSNQLTLTQLHLLQASVKLSGKLQLLDDSKLDELLAEIYIVQPESETNVVWTQFLAWLNSFKPERYEAEFNWLINFLETLTPSIEHVRIIMYWVFGLMIFLVVVLLIRELYLSSVLVWGERKSQQDSSQTRDNRGESTPKLRSVEIKQLSPKIQMTTLFKQVIEDLMHYQDLPKNEALTNVELKNYLEQQKSPKADAFSMILTDVEPVLYGNNIPSEKTLSRCWQYAEQIVNS